MESANTDEMSPPAWLNKEFFEKALRSFNRDDAIVINHLKITPGSVKGDHLASIIFRVVAEYTSSQNRIHEQSMIVKTIPEAEGFKKDMLDKSEVFETEIGVYSDVIPKFEAILRKHGDNTRFGARVIYYSLTPYKVIVFEDLVALGYDCIRDRLAFEDELKGCLAKLAKWHAASYKLVSEGDESITKYKGGMLAQPQEELPEFLSAGFRNFIECLSKLDGMETYVERFRALESTFFQKCYDIFHAHDRGAKGIMVLNHGDFHMRNVMFKYDTESKFEDVLFVDFQISCYAPVAIDIFYAIYMLLTEEMRRYRREEMIYFYFSEFLKNLKKIEFAGELPTLADLYIDLYKFREYELWTMTTFLPLVHALKPKEDGKQVETEELVSSSDALNSMYSNSDFISELKWLLPRYLHHGYLS